MGGIGGIVDGIKNTVQQVAQTVQRVAEEVGKKVNEITNPAVQAHQGQDGFDPGPVAESRDRPGGPTVYKPGDGPHVA
jgi:hypothetical protein